MNQSLTHNADGTVAHDAVLLNDNYRKRVDILTDVNVSILTILVGNPMIAAVAGPEFVAEVSNLVTMLTELRFESMSNGNVVTP